MQNYFDFVILGFGPIAREFIASLTSDSILLVTNRQNLDIKSNHNLKIMDYSSACLEASNFSTSHCIIMTNLLLEKDQTKKFQEIQEICLKINAQRTTYLSSVSVYPSSRLPKNEGSKTIGISKYSKLKLEFEFSLRKALSSRQFQVLRISNVYGSSGLSNLFDKAESALHNGSSINIPKKLHNRDFVSILDLSEY